MPNSRSVNYQFICTIILLLLLSAVIILIVIIASVPPVSRDGLTHHLAIPKLYLEHGGMYEIPGLIFSYYPMNVTMLYAIPLYFGNDIIPKYIHFSFALITASLIYRYLVRRINREYALLGVLFFLTLPVIIRLSTTVYVDLGLICFSFASLLYIFHWIEYGFKTRYLIISAVFCGLAMGTKYNGLVSLFLLSMFVAYIYARYHAGTKLYAIKSIYCSAVFILVALMIFSPWMLRNFAWTGNPIYPLYNSVFVPESASENFEPDTVFKERIQMSHIQVRRDIYGESWLEIALIPLRVFFQGKDDTPKYFDGKANPFLLILPFFAFFGIRAANRQERAEKFMLLFFSVLFLLYACAQASIRIRYFAPILPPLVILSMFGLHHLQNAFLGQHPRISDGLKKAITLGIVFVMIGLNMNYMADRFKKDQPLAYINGKVSRDQYIQAYRPEYASFQFANQNLGQDAKILGLYIGERGYYSDIAIDFNIEILQQLAAKALSGDDIAKKLHQMGFTHLLVNSSGFNFWVQKYSSHERRMLKEFFDTFTVIEFTKSGHGLIRILYSSDDTSTMH